LELAIKSRYPLFQFEYSGRQAAHLLRLSSKRGNTRKRDNGENRPSEKGRNREQDQKFPS